MSNSKLFENDDSQTQMDEEIEENMIVDCDVLEASKENIQPLASGRRATTLASVLATPHHQRDIRLAATKARLRERVETVKSQFEALETEKGGNGGDTVNKEDVDAYLLDSYACLVNWTIEHYPQGHSAESGILELLEEATRVLRRSQFAKADARYLNLWISYANYVERPEIIYEYLLANDIGTDWARLYEEYALVLDRSGRRTKADEIYLLGIARKAAPLEHLTKRHGEFQKRMMTSTPVLGSIASPVLASSSTTSSDSTVPRRVILGESTSSSSTSSSRRATPLLRDEDVFTATSSSGSLPGLGTRQNGRMPIFVDPTGDEAGAASRNPWPELGTRKERTKENTRTTEKMQGTILKQKGASKVATRAAAAKAKSGVKIIPFRDPELENDDGPETMNDMPFKTPARSKFMPFIDESGDAQSTLRVPATPRFVPFRDETILQTPAPSGIALPAPESVMRLKAVAGSTSSEAEALRKDPFKNYKDH